MLVLLLLAGAQQIKEQKKLDQINVVVIYY